MNDRNIEHKITIMKRDRNYGSDDIEGLISSLKHSLRLDQNEYDDFERDEKLSYLNRITINGETGELKEDESFKILEKIIDDFTNDVNETKNTSLNEKERNLYRQNRKKLKDYSASIDIEEISKYIDETMNGLNQFNQNDYAQILSRNNQKRINQKVELLQSYIELDLKLKDNEKVKTHTNRVKEVVVVIPEKNKIGDLIGYCDFLRTTAIDFYKEFFPDFDIKFAVSHADETSPHAHLFIDLKNNKTNKYDFNKKEKEFIDNFIKNNPEIIFDKKPEPDSYKLKRRSLKKQQYLYQRDLKKWHGEILQTAFYKFFNYSAKTNNKPIYAEKLEKTKEYDERNKLIEEDAKKPKSERKFNYYTKKIEDMEKVINDLQSENIAVLKDNKNLKTDKINLNNELKELQKTFDIGKTAVNNNQLKQNQQNAEIKKKDQIIKLKEDLILQKDNEISNITNEKKILTKENTELKTSIVESRQRYNKLFNYNVKEEKKNKELAEENKKLTDDNFKLKSAYEILTKNFIDLQKNLVLEVKNIFKKMKNIEVKLVGETEEKSLKVKVIDFLKGGKETVSGLSAFLSKADYSDDILIENKILEAAKPQFEVNNFMSLKLTSSILDDATFKKENPELSKINEKVIKPVLKNKSEDDFVNDIKIKEIGLFKDNPEVKEEYKEYVEPEKRSKVIKPQ